MLHASDREHVIGEVLASREDAAPRLHAPRLHGGPLRVPVSGRLPPHLSQDFSDGHGGSTCPVCLEARCLILFPCGHPICAPCSDRTRRECPTCRQSGEASAAHAPLDALSRLCHCSRCSTRYNRATHMPVLLQPCFHHMCRACLDDASSCPQCESTVTGGVDDHAFFQCIEGTHVPAPPPLPRASAAPPAPPPTPPPMPTLDSVMDAMCTWLHANQDIYDDDWYVTQDAQRRFWSDARKTVWNALMEFATTAGIALASVSSASVQTIKPLSDALGLPNSIGSPVYFTIVSAFQIARTRTAQPAYVQRLPIRASQRLHVAHE
jgi:hypothetical protein